MTDSADDLTPEIIYINKQELITALALAVDWHRNGHNIFVGVAWPGKVMARIDTPHFTEWGRYVDHSDLENIDPARVSEVVDIMLQKGRLLNCGGANCYIKVSLEE